jgi:hypothetical protein
MLRFVPLETVVVVRIVSTKVRSLEHMGACPENVRFYEPNVLAH